MKILYLGNFENPFSDATEKHIKYALEKAGHTVVTFDENDFDAEKILAEKGDLFLFHKGGVGSGKVEIPQLVELLNKLTCKKVMWYFDKVWREREIFMRTLVPFCDYAFVTDETWARRHNYKNVHIVRQGISNQNPELGTLKERYKADIVYVGSVYGEREKFIEIFQRLYGKRFKVVNDAFGRNLYDLCASAKIVIAPKFPQDDFYWSSRVYMITGSGGFIIHPKLEGLKEEFKDGEHLVMYHDLNDLKDKIDYYLEHEDERLKIKEAGYKLCHEKYTYETRVNTILGIINAK